MARKATTDYGGIQPDRKNANKGTVRGRGMVEASLRETGAGRSILLDKDGRIIAGNKTFEAATDIGLPVRIVETNGKELVAVKRTDLDLDDDTGMARKLAYYDNRASQVGLEWDAEVVLADLGAGVDLSAMFRQDELDELLADLLPKATEGDTPAEVDRAEELRQKWGTAPGQLWQLGEHRLVCGDCTDPATVARVMGGDVAEVIVTDPPYGIMALGGRRQTHQAKGIEFIENDDLTGDALVDFLVDSISLAPVSDSSSFYVCYGWKSQVEFTQALKQCGLTLRATITWVKNVFGLSAKNNVGYRPQTEFIYFATKSPEYVWKWHGGGTQSDAWHIDRPVERVGNHPTNKPIDLPVKCIENSSDSGDVVYDPFLGSGTTIIACENLGRRCRAVEISPAYVAVALERWAQHTGKTPVLLDELTL